jgi:hypothetical protein
MKAHDKEKPLSSPKELQPGKWREYLRNKQTYLHPVKDELFVIKESGQLGRWCYTPEPTFVDGFEIADISGLRFSPDGEWFVIMVPLLGRIEIRSTTDLRCMFASNSE